VKSPLNKYTLATVLLGLLLLVSARRLPGFSEWYARHVFPVFPHVLGRIFALLPFSAFEWLLLGCLLGLVFLIVYGVANLRHPASAGCHPLWKGGFGRGRRRALRRLPAILCLLGSLFLWFVMTCGVNYSRDSFAVRLGVTVAPASQEELLQLYQILLRQAEERTEPPEEEALEAGFDRKEGAEQAREAMRALNTASGGLIRYFPPPKPIFFSRLMSYLNLAGVFSSFTMEANYNQDMPASSIPFTMCHELAHLSGYAREDEANFISYLACRESDAAAFRYSGAYRALGYVLNALAQAVSPEEYQELYQQLPERAARDFQVNRDYWRQFSGPAADVYDRINDYYLKANAQKDGVYSYGRMVDLLLAYYRT
jgi:hypothetical protein